MARYVVCGKADCAGFAMAEALAHHVATALPHVRLQINTSHPEDWDRNLEYFCRSRGFTHESSPLVWMGEGTYIGGYQEFAQQVEEYYGIRVPVDGLLMDEIAGENLARVEEAKLEEATDQYMKERAGKLAILRPQWSKLEEESTVFDVVVESWEAAESQLSDLRRAVKEREWVKLSFAEDSLMLAPPTPVDENEDDENAENDEQTEPNATTEEGEEAQGVSQEDQASVPVETVTDSAEVDADAEAGAVAPDNDKPDNDKPDNNGEGDAEDQMSTEQQSDLGQVGEEVAGEEKEPPGLHEGDELKEMILSATSSLGTINRVFEDPLASAGQMGADLNELIDEYNRYRELLAATLQEWTNDEVIATSLEVFEEFSGCVKTCAEKGKSIADEKRAVYHEVRDNYQSVENFKDYSVPQNILTSAKRRGLSERRDQTGYRGF